MKIHIFHHFDADGYCSAAVLIKYLLGQADKEDIKCYSCIHSSQMDFSHVEKDDFVFILDYSFPEVDKPEIIKLYNNVTKNIYWIDHHDTSKDVINENEVFSKIAENGFVEVSNRYAGCLLTYFWCKHFIFVNSSDIVQGTKYSLLNTNSNTDSKIILRNTSDYKKIYDMVPNWIALVSDHDTFKHNIPNSKELVKGIYYEGPYELFLNTESDRSFIYGNCDIDELIKSLVNVGSIILESESRSNKRIIKNNSFVKEFHVIDEKGNEGRFSVICVNGHGNSDLFGELYTQYDAVCSFHYNGMNYMYNLYANDDSPIKCSTIGKYYKLKYGITGGGHEHAAGWAAPINIFDSVDKVIEINLS